MAVVSKRKKIQLTDQMTLILLRKPFIRINSVKSSQTQQSFIDVILNIFTGFVSVYSRDVKVLAGGASGTPALSAGGTNYIALGNQSMMAKDYNGAVQNYQNAANANPIRSALIKVWVPLIIIWVKKIKRSALLKELCN